MSSYVEALAADRAVLQEICVDLDDLGWDTPSGCPGWTVKDVVAHMGILFWAVVDPGALPPEGSGRPTEEAQEIYVASRRAMSAPQVVHDYAAVSEKALSALETFAGVENEVPLGDLGTYPMDVLPAAFCFDHFVHIRADLFGPRGPLTEAPPPSDQLRLGPALDWVEAALPQQNKPRIDGLAGQAEIVVTGPVPRTLRLGDPNAAVTASVTSDADSFVRWVTQRADWADLGIHGQGDEADLAILRSLKVF